MQLRPALGLMRKHAKTDANSHCERYANLVIDDDDDDDDDSKCIALHACTSVQTTLNITKATREKSAK